MSSIKYNRLFRLLSINIFFILCFSIHLNAQNQTLSGYVTDMNTGEGLIGAYVYDSLSLKNAMTNEYGFYSLTFPEGNVELKATYIGYAAARKSLHIDKSQTLDFALQGLDLPEITVTDKQEKAYQKNSMSVVNIPVAQIKRMPALGGEVDILKTLTLVPGISTGGEGNSRLYVRGGSPDQNLILLDGTTVYNVTHLAGFISVFDINAIKNVELLKGGFPARYGGRLSSVLNIAMKEGNNKKLSGKFGISPISSKFMLEGPLKKDRSSFLLTGRASYLGLIGASRKNSYEANQSSDDYLNYYLYDINAKLNQRVGDKGKVFFSFYTGRDFSLNKRKSFQRINGTIASSRETSYGLKWGNITSTLRYNHEISSKLFSKTSLFYSRYDYEFTNKVSTEVYEEGVAISNNTGRFRSRSGVEDIGFKTHFDYAPSSNHLIRFGAEITRHEYEPGLNLSSNSDSTSTDTIGWNSFARGDESAAYIEDEIKLHKNLSINAGIRWAGFQTDENFYHSIEPRISLSYLFSDDYSLKASYTRMQQYVHLLSNSGLGFPNDIWVSATDRTPPAVAHQWALGVESYIEKWKTDISVEAYYKKMSRLIDYKTNGFTQIGLSSDWENTIERDGKGTAYGLEYFMRKQEGKFTGMLGYTLSWNYRQFENINEGRAFSFKYDRRHDFSTAVSYRISPKWDVSGTWVYTTGHAVTLPTGSIANPVSYYGPILVYGDRNNGRMPNYHRLDMNISRTTKGKKRGNVEHKFSASVYNAYARKNPYYLHIDEYVTFGENMFDVISRETKAYQTSIFGIVPSISYDLSF